MQITSNGGRAGITLDNFFGGAGGRRSLVMTCASFPCATYDPPLFRILSGEQRYLVFSGYVGDIAAGRPLRLSSNLSSKPFAFTH